MRSSIKFCGSRATTARRSSRATTGNPRTSRSTARAPRQRRTTDDHSPWPLRLCGSGGRSGWRALSTWEQERFDALLKPSETDYLYAAKGDSRAALSQAVADAVAAIEKLRSRLEGGLVWLHARGALAS